MGATSRDMHGDLEHSSRVWQLLQHAPCLVPFPERARLFQANVARGREVSRGMAAGPTFVREHLLPPQRLVAPVHSGVTCCTFL